MYSGAMNNPRNISGPPAGSRNRRTQNLRQSPPPAAGSSASGGILGASTLGGGLFGSAGTGKNTAGYQQRDRERDHREQRQDTGTQADLSEEQRAEINEAVSAVSTRVG
jgi:hypothetical protein